MADAAGEWQMRVDRARDLGKTHACCVTDCPNDTLLGFLACRTHWLALPRPTRHVLGLAFQRRTERPDLAVEAARLARELLAG